MDEVQVGNDSQDKCPNCGKPGLYENVTDSINGTPCEVETICPSCGGIAFWAYGHYEPAGWVHEDGQWKPPAGGTYESRR